MRPGRQVWFASLIAARRDVLTMASATERRYRLTRKYTEGVPMSETMYNAYDKDGRFVGEYRTQEEAEEASRRANEFARQEAAEIAAENEVLRAKPTQEDKLLVNSLGPGLHLSISQPPSRTRSSVIFRGIWGVPYVLLGLAQLVIAIPVTMAAWFAILLTGDYPPMLFAYNAHMVRYLVRVTGYTLLVSDLRPPLSGRANPLYPIQVDVNRAPTYDRALVAFRLPLLIPLAIASFVTLVLAMLALVVSILVVRLTKHQPAALQAVMTLYLRVYAQFLASATLLTSDWWLVSARASGS